MATTKPTTTGNKHVSQFESTFNPWSIPEYEGRILFIGGIPKDCTDDELYSFLAKFDIVEWQRVEKDTVTGDGKGFAYAVLATAEGQAKIVTSRNHRIRDLQIGVSIWMPKKDYICSKDLNMQRKVFVKRLTAECAEDDLRKYFSKYGKVEKTVLMRNHHDNTSRRIGFIHFQTEEATNKCLNQKTHILMGYEIMVKKCKKPSDLLKERSGTDGLDSDRHRSFTISDDSHSQQDWSFFSQAALSMTNGSFVNNSMSFRENSEQPTFNFSNTSCFLSHNGINTCASNSLLSDSWRKGVIAIKEEDETQETIFLPILGSPQVMLPDSDEIDFDLPHFHKREPHYMRIEVNIGYYTFPGYE